MVFMIASGYVCVCCPGSDGSLNMLNSIEIGSLLSGSSGSGSGSSTPPEKPSKRSQKRKASEELWKNPKRKSGEDNEILMETSSSDSTSMSTPTSHDAVSEMGMATPNSALGFHSDLELSGLDAPELTEKAPSEYDSHSREADDLGDVEEILAATSRSEHKQRKLRDERKTSTSSLLLELGENKNLVPPSVSITPITTSSQSGQGFNQVLTNMGLERRPGIEIIPIATAPATSLPSSITITPISSTHNKSSSDEQRRSDKKSSKSRSDDKSRLEKKRKRKRDEGPMGPPDKLPPKQDPLSKPVSVSIKPAESPPLPGITPTSPNMLRKFSSSPTQQSRSLSSLSGKSSPSMLKPMKSSSSSSSSTGGSSSHHSPKHSPAHVISSPKHASLPGMSSPKNHGTSPKHPSASSTGKPSMSTLKSAANSPSSKSGESKVKSSKDSSSNRDKEKKLSSNMFSVNNPKVKSSSVKLKQLDITTGVDLQTFQSTDSLPSPSGTMDLSKSSALNQVRNRKGSLSAVIDKLKSAQHCGSEGEASAPPPSGSNSGNSGNGKSSNRENRDGRSSSASGKITDQKTTSKVGENKNSEYMVKPSSDGIKITINKTRTKESSKSSSSSNMSKVSAGGGTGSPKTHTGLKPGVNSGPASKKPQQLNQKSSISNAGSTYSGGSMKSGSSSGKISSSSSVGKTSSGSGSLVSKSVSKLTGSPKTATASDLSRKDGRPRLNKSSSDKSIFSSSKNDARRSSPTAARDETDSERAFKLLSQPTNQVYPTALMMEGMIKTLDTNFQIPKLSARTSDADKKTSSNKLTTSYSDSSINNISRTVDATKMYDMMAKNDLSLSKYPLALTSNAKPFENNLKNNLVSMTSTSPLLPSSLTTTALPFGPSSSPKLNMVSPSHMKDLTIEQTLPSDLTTTSDSSDKTAKAKDLSVCSSATTKEDISTNCNKINYPISAQKNFPVVAPPTSDTTIKPIENVKFSSPQPQPPLQMQPQPQHKPAPVDEKKLELKAPTMSKCGTTSNQEAAEMLLDFSSNSMGKPPVPDHIASKLVERPIPLVPLPVHRTSPLPLGPPPSYPSSPSVSVHIVKSPAPSPLVNPSPHSASPCITDDELMDEALVGLGK